MVPRGLSRLALVVCLGLLVELPPPAEGGLFDRVHNRATQYAHAAAQPIRDLFGGGRHEPADKTETSLGVSKDPDEGDHAGALNAPSAGTVSGEVKPPSLFHFEGKTKSSKKLLELYQAQAKKLPSFGLSNLTSGAQSFFKPLSSASSKVVSSGASLLGSILSASIMIQGELSAPKSGYSEPYTIRFDPATGASRVDFHGGATSVYATPTATGEMQKVEVREERWGGRPVRRCAIAAPGAAGASTAAASALSLLPDLSNFSFGGILSEEGGKPQQKLLHTVTGAAGQLGAAPGEALSFHHELLLADGPAGIPLPTKYSVSVDSSVLGAGSDSFQHTYHQVLLQPHGPEVFQPQLEACDETEEVPADSPSLDPLREFTMQHRDTKYDSLLEKFKSNYGLKYLDNIEEAIRKNLFVLHSRFVEAINRSGASFLLELNFLADRLDSELAILRGGSEDDDPESASNTGQEPQSKRRRRAAELPAEFDWRDQGAVTPVEYQGECASCWAFAVSGAVEGAAFVKSGKLVPLAKQTLLDCGQQYGARGCRGTWPERAFDYVAARGLPAASDYGPYSAAVGTCQAGGAPAAARIARHEFASARDMSALQAAIHEHGPAVVLLNAKPKTFVFYKSGVLDAADCTEKSKADLNHATLAVGWGEKDGEKHLIVKNSWSDKWGDAGYVRVAVKNNTCGVLSQPYYTVMDS